MKPDINFARLEAGCLQLIALLDGLLYGREPALPAEPDWPQVFDIAHLHGLEAIAWQAAGDRVAQRDPELAARWQKRTDQLLMQTLLQQQEEQALTGRFRQEGIPFVCLKGMVLRELYPQPQLRQLSDLDLLIPPEQMDAAAAILEARGYRLEEDAERTPYHRGYQRPPYLQVELHTDLLDRNAAYFPAVCDPWGHLDPSGERLDALYTYLYCVIHAAKHYYYKGTGIRTVLDLHLLRAAGGFDADAVETALRQIRLEGFHREFCALCDGWFGGPAPQALPAELDSMARVVFAAGIHGSPYARAAGAMGGGSGAGFVLRRAFPDYRTMVATYPVLGRHPLLLPWFWAHRLFTRVLQDPRAVGREMSYRSRLHRR